MEMAKPRAEVLSQTWALVAHMEELRDDLATRIRRSVRRDAALTQLDGALAKLVEVTTHLGPGAKE
jgi:hypothetical protein